MDEEKRGEEGGARKGGRERYNDKYKFFRKLMLACPAHGEAIFKGAGEEEWTVESDKELFFFLLALSFVSFARRIATRRDFERYLQV